MENENFTPEQSLQLISKVIHQARNRVSENGDIYIFWGILVALAASAQFYLFQIERFEISYYPYYLMPLGGIYAYYYYSKKQKRSPNQVSKVVSATWMAITANVILLGFGFWSQLTSSLIPVILILLGVGTVINSRLIKSQVFLFSGIVINLSGFICFYIDWLYHPLVLAIVAIVAIFIPGIIIKMRHEQKKDI